MTGMVAQRAVPCSKAETNVVRIVVQAQPRRTCERRSHLMSQPPASTGGAQISLCGMHLAFCVSEGAYSSPKIPPQIRTIICGLMWCS